jgi:hypothetical protein
LEEERRWRIEWAPRTMEEIRACAVRGLNGIGHGGVEVGGVLLGTRLGSFYRILDWRPISCQHAFGPAFHLSERDEAALGEMLGSLGEGESSWNLQALGWFVSHTRREPAMNDQEQRVFSSFFPGEGALSLMLRPNRFGEMEVRVHVRPSAGQDAEALKPALAVDPAPLPGAFQRTERVAPEPNAFSAPVEVSPEAVPVVPLPQAVSAVEQPRRAWREWLLPAAMMAGLAATAGFAWQRLPLKRVLAGPPSAALTASPQPLHLLSLHAGPAPDGLRLSWSTEGGWMDQTDHAVVEFVSRDNQLVTQTLQREDLSRGSLVLDLSSSSHEVALSVYAGGNRLLARERVTWHEERAAP